MQELNIKLEKCVRVCDDVDVGIDVDVNNILVIFGPSLWRIYALCKLEMIA